MDIFLAGAEVFIKNTCIIVTMIVLLTLALLISLMAIVLGLVCDAWEFAKNLIKERLTIK